MKLAIIFNSDKLSGKLTKLFTGCYAYHTAWVDEDNGAVYDMHLTRRKRAWPQYANAQVLLFDFPEVTRDYLERQLIADKRDYGYLDYVLFSVRWLFHLVGASTWNADGVICSEMVNEDARACGVETPWDEFQAPPSPCDWYRWLKDRFAGEKT